MNRSADTAFVARIKKEIEAVLRDDCPALKAELDRIKQDRQYAPVDLAAALERVARRKGDPSQERAGGLEDLVNHVLRPATVACLRPFRYQPDTAEFRTRWSAARRILALLCVLAVDGEWVEDLARSADITFEFPVRTNLGVQILSARIRQRTMPLQTAAGTDDLPNADQFAVPATPMPIGRLGGYNVGTEVAKLMLEIWRQLFPSSKRDRLSDNDIRNLNAELGVRETNRINHHYLAFSPDQDTPLNDRQFLEALLGKLTNLVVIRIAVGAESHPLLTRDEHCLLAAVRAFLEIPEELKNQP